MFEALRFLAGGAERGIVTSTRAGRWEFVLTVVYRLLCASSGDTIDGAELFDTLGAVFYDRGLVVPVRASGASMLRSETAFRVGLLVVEIGSIMEEVTDALLGSLRPVSGELLLQDVDECVVRLQLTVHRMLPKPMADALSRDAVLGALCTSVEMARSSRWGSTPRITITCDY